jgi:hypothetical protein
MEKAKGKTSKGNEVEFEVNSDDWLSCSSKDLVELIIPKGCKGVFCQDNQLTELIIPEGCKWVSCKDNQLTELIIPDGCKGVRSDLGLINLNDYKDSNIDFKFFVK